MNPINSIIIVGGGTAGWLTAGFLSAQLPQLSITVIESDSVPIVGVGESTVPQFRNHLERMGIDEHSWMKASGSTFKYGVAFHGWRTSTDFRWHGFGDYLTEKIISRSPQEYGKRASMVDRDSVLLSDYWIQLLKQGYITEDHIPWYASDTYHLYQHNKAHRTIDGHQYMSRVPGYAYNINAYKLGQTIREQVALPNRVKHIRQHITRVNRNERGGIINLVDAEGNTHSADLYWDCTGFKKILIGPVSNWISLSFQNHLPCRSAVGGRVYYENDQEKFCVPAVVATALGYGWAWSVPLRDDIGSGYVFDQTHISVDQAVEEIKQHWRKLGKDWHHKVTLNFENGILDRSAHENIVACGLSSNFLEPLEATSISFTTLINELVVAMLKKNSCTWDNSSAKVVSRLMKREVKYTGSFLWAHYGLTQRTDTKFWQNQTATRDQAKQMCYDWFYHHQGNIYRREKDFDHTRYNKYDWAQMITTQRIYHDCPTRAINPALLNRAKMFYDYQNKMSYDLMNQLPSHWQLIQHINQT